MDSSQCASFAQIIPVFLLITVLDVRFLRGAASDGVVASYISGVFFGVFVLGQSVAMYGAAMDGVGDGAAKIILYAAFGSFFYTVGAAIESLRKLAREHRAGRPPAGT